MARVEVPMPQMGESIAEGTVSKWLKKVGDRVERDEPILEISTDKVDAEIPSPAAGVLAEILVPEGKTVEVGTVLAYIETEVGASASATPAAAPAAQATPTAPAVTEEGAAAPAPNPTPPEVKTVTAAAVAAPDVGADGTETEASRLRRRSSPLVRRIAAEHGIDLTQLQGSGRHGRVTKDDILRVVAERQRQVAAVSTPSAPATSAPPAPSGFPWDAFYREVVHPEVPIGPHDRVEPMSRMTRLIAEHMVLSRRISPHVHSYFEVDYTRVDRIRAQRAAEWEAQGVKVTYTAFIAWAVARALREHPKINATISGENIVYRGEINLGIAVALDDGLIVPVVKHADELSLVGLARRINDLASRARSKKLSPEEVQGGTFTITNPGIFGTVLGFPIINQPQAAILGVGAVEKRVVVVTDASGQDAIAIRKRGYLSLGYDHRLINGADADRFLARVKDILENFPETA